MKPTRKDLVRHLGTIIRQVNHHRNGTQFRAAAYDVLASSRDYRFWGRGFGEWVAEILNEPDGGKKTERLVHDAYKDSIEFENVKFLPWWPI